MASVLWDAHGILFFDYLEKGRTINSNYYIFPVRFASGIMDVMNNLTRYVIYDEKDLASTISMSGDDEIVHLF